MYVGAFLLCLEGSMSMNYCEKNPVDGVLNSHCFHPYKLGPDRKNGTRNVVCICCWCGNKTNDTEFVKHGEFIKESKDVDTRSTEPGPSGKLLSHPLRGQQTPRRGK